MKNILIAGLPGVGKTTIIKRLCEIFKEFNPAGFYTREIIENGARTGFELESLYGETRLFAHINLKSKHVVGKYKIDIKGFDEFLDHILLKEKKTGLYFIDEIGKMEIESKKFCKLAKDLLDSGKPVVAAIPEKGTGIISEIRKREDVRVFELTTVNRDLRLKDLTMAIRDILIE